MNGERLTTPETDDGESVEFYMPEKTKINGMSYLPVTDTEEDDEDGDCYILKDMSRAEEADAVCESVEGDDEIDHLFKIFSELTEDMDVDPKK